jgi:hypothetical protein
MGGFRSSYESFGVRSIPTVNLRRLPRVLGLETLTVVIRLSFMEIGRIWWLAAAAAVPPSTRTWR